VESLRQAVRARDDFIAIAAHGHCQLELRGTSLLQFQF
jgi:hypothetical protein